jgi:hypothetical protein
MTRQGYNLKALLLFFVLVFAFFVYRHHDLFKAKNYGDWPHQLMADAGGYYVYLPAWFDYGWDAANYKPDEPDKIGNGFTLNHTSEKVFTKYPAGVALLQAPFYLALKGWYYVTGNSHSYQPFDNVHANLIGWVAAFYSSLGCVLLVAFLLHWFSASISYMTVLAVLLGSNLLYYTVAYPGFSHAYSFFLFSALLLISQVFRNKPRPICFLLMALFIGLIVAVRPINILLVPACFFLSVDSFSWAELRAKFLKPLNALILISALAVVLFPQFSYWMKLTGSPIFYSYESEGFSRWNDPGILLFFFSPSAGLFTYNPLYLILFIALFYFVLRKKQFAIILLLTELVLIYLYASWHAINFGNCNYGNRNLVEHLPLLVFPLAYFFSKTYRLAHWIKWLGMMVLILLSVEFNLKVSNRFYFCFFGQSVWDWPEYRYLLFNQTKKYSLAKGENELSVYTKDFKQPFIKQLDIQINGTVNNPNADLFLVMEFYFPTDTLYNRIVPLNKHINNNQLNYGECYIIERCNQESGWVKMRLESADANAVQINNFEVEGR